MKTIKKIYLEDCDGLPMRNSICRNCRRKMSIWAREQYEGEMISIIKEAEKDMSKNAADMCLAIIGIAVTEVLGVTGEKLIEVTKRAGELFQETGGAEPARDLLWEKTGLITCVTEDKDGTEHVFIGTREEYEKEGWTFDE